MQTGHIIAKHRMEKGISQRELAEALNVKTSTVGLWEVNKRFPSPDTLIQIADYFNISMDTLFSEDRKNKSYTREDSNPLCPDCVRLIEYYEAMNEESKEILMGEARKLLREQRLEEKRETQSVAKMA